MTAVEWFYEQIKFTDKDTYNELYEQYQQAKEMFEQQIIDAYERGWDMGAMPNDCNSEQYYNKTYKKDKL